jgi:hypothetical protein
MKAKFSLLLLMVVSGLFLFAQKSDSTKNNKEYKNNIRYNIASAMIFNFDKAIIFGYERVLSPHRSFSINMGSTGFPGGRAFSEDSISMRQATKSSGFNFSGDYRFYLSKENKYHAPHGIYIGPYYSYNNFSKDNEWEYKQESGAPLGVSTNTNFKVHTFGVELGYQFVLWKRMTLDFVMVGPGLSGYSLKATVQGDLTEEQKQKIRDAIVSVISEKFPGLTAILGEHPLNTSGTFNTTSIGFRYLMHIGFLF